MSIFDPEPKKDIVLKKYPTYTLVGRILEKDIEEYKETKNPELILYKFCSNGIKYIPNDDNVTRNKPGSNLVPR